jgi:hypothetical protein
MSKYLHGLHDPGGEHLMGDKPGWIVFTEELGHDPDIHTGRDYRPWSGQGFTPIARLNNGYYPNGTIPEIKDYDKFAIRCGNFVEASAGCHFWIIGNEPNHEQERPNGNPILPADYALCFVMCREEILSRRGHEFDFVCTAGIAPWNNTTHYQGNERGDWVQYFQDMLNAVLYFDNSVDAITLHTYTHGPDPSLIFAQRKMDPPFEDRYYDFQCYREFMAVIPAQFKDVPVLITETDQNDPWLDEDNGWIQNAYLEIDHWNRDLSHQTIHSLVLYRYPRIDQWFIEGKHAVESAFEEIVSIGYTWKEKEPMTWIERHRDAFESGFYDQDGITELTIPVGHTVYWEGDRPEMDKKVVPQPEVYEGLHSAVGFLPYKVFKWWTVSDLIAVQPGKRTRASAAVMIIAHGVDGDMTKPGACGMQVGISGPNEDDVNSPNIVWSDWFVVRDTLDNEGVWVVLRTGEIIPAANVQHVRIFVRCNADVAAAISAGHWDLEIVEQYLDEEPPVEPPVEPPTGTTHKVETYIDGQLVSTGHFEVLVGDIILRPVQGVLSTVKGWFGK